MQVQNTHKVYLIYGYTWTLRSGGENAMWVRANETV